MAYISPAAGAFNPIGNTVTFLGNTAAPTAIQAVGTTANINYSYCQYRIFNSGSYLTFIGYGSSATIANNNAIVVSTSNTGLPILPGTVEIISAPANSYFTGITASGTSQIYVTPGLGV
jgi:hypothetical protein